MAGQDLFGDLPAPRPARTAPRRTKVPQAAHAWFFALRPGREDASRIAARAGDLLARHGVSGQRLAPDRLHISLDAVGDDVDAEIVEAACRAADTVRFSAVDVRLDGIETYGGPSLVLVGDEGVAGVRALRLALGCALADQGFRPPTAYGPHMTLCYDPRPAPARTAIEPVVFRATEFALVRSHIGFARHEVVRTWPLASQ